MLTWLWLVSAIVGAAYAAGNAGFIPAWGDRPRSIVVLALAVLGAVFLAADGDYDQGFLVVALSCIGAAKLAELATSSVLELRGATRRRDG